MSWCIFIRNSRSLTAVFGYLGIFVSFWSTNDSWLSGPLGEWLGRSRSQIGGTLACGQSKILYYVVVSNILEDGMMGWNHFKGWLKGIIKQGLAILLMEEIPRSPVEVGSLSHYLQGFIHPRCLAGFLSSAVGGEASNIFFIFTPRFVENSHFD